MPVIELPSLPSVPLHRPCVEGTSNEKRSFEKATFAQGISKRLRSGLSTAQDCRPELSLLTTIWVRNGCPFTCAVPSQIPSMREGFSAGMKASRVKTSGMGVPCDHMPERVPPLFSIDPVQEPLTAGTLKESVCPSIRKSAQGIP